MVKRIAISMVAGLQAEINVINTQLEIIPTLESPHEVGDLIWSARAIKSKCLKCEAQAVSRTVYALLFSEIGTTFGAGDGSTTFNLPDGRGRALIGVGTGTLTESFAAAAVAPATDLITVASNADKWITGMIVQASTTGTLPTGLAAATNYYVIRISATTIKLASSLANALAGTAIDITAAGSGTHTLTHTLTARALGDKGGEEGVSLTAAKQASMPLTGTASVSGSASVRTQGGSTGAMAARISADVDSATAFGTISAPVTASGSLSGTATGGGEAHNNMPPFLGANLFIYAGV